MGGTVRACSSCRINTYLAPPPPPSHFPRYIAPYNETHPAALKFWRMLEAMSNVSYGPHPPPPPPPPHTHTHSKMSLWNGASLPSTVVAQHNHIRTHTYAHLHTRMHAHIHAHMHKPPRICLLPLITVVRPLAARARLQMQGMRDICIDPTCLFLDTCCCVGAACTHSCTTMPQPTPRLTRCVCAGGPSPVPAVLLGPVPPTRRGSLGQRAQVQAVSAHKAGVVRVPLPAFCQEPTEWYRVPPVSWSCM